MGGNENPILLGPKRPPLPTLPPLFRLPSDGGEKLQVPWRETEKGRKPNHSPQEQEKQTQENIAFS